MSRRSKCRFVKERVLVLEPSLQSRASLLLLKKELRKLDDEPEGYKKWLEFRLAFLAEKEKSEGPQYCFYCKCGPLLSDVDQADARCATLDHVIPLAKGGPKYDKNNLVVSCQSCNGSKKDKSLEDFLKTQIIPIDKR